MNCLPLKSNLSRSIPPYDNGVFSTCASNGICFHRNHFSNEFIDVIKPDGKELTRWTRGEDPRVFETHGIVYLVTNYLNNMKLLKLNGTNILNSWNLPFLGKNIMPVHAKRSQSHIQFLDIQHKKLYTLKFFKNEAIITQKMSFRLHMQENPYCFSRLQNCIFRGGTAGTKRCNGIVGAGHCTECPGSKLDTHMATSKSCIHKPFLWYYQFQKNLSVFPLCLSSQKIIDPTTIFENKLLTSESDTWWFTSNQSFFNREYRVQV